MDDGQQQSQRYVYIGFCRQCARLAVAVEDDPNHRKYTARCVAGMIERGLYVERHRLPLGGDALDDGPRFALCECGLRAR